MSSRSPRSMWKTTSSNPIPRSALSFAFFASSQSKYFTDNQLSTTCAHQAHVGIGQSVPKSVPTRGPNPVIRQPTATRQPKKTGLKSWISGPFRDSWQPQQTAIYHVLVQGSEPAGTAILKAFPSSPALSLQPSNFSFAPTI